MDIIVGGGKYGCWAAEFLRERRRGFAVVDVNSDCLAVRRIGLKITNAVDGDGEHFVQGGLETVLDLIEGLEPEFVFPTAPVHIAADLAKEKFGLKPWPEGINPVLLKLPPSVVLLAGKGRLIASFNRDHECIDKCSMPKVCPSSGIRKPCTMTELMRFASPEAFILVSHSMAPGMGALKGNELADFFNWVKTKKEFVVSTTCDCHGVISAFRKNNL